MHGRHERLGLYAVAFNWIFHHFDPTKPPLLTCTFTSLFSILFIFYFLSFSGSLRKYRRRPCTLTSHAGNMENLLFYKTVDKLSCTPVGRKANSAVNNKLTKTLSLISCYRLVVLDTALFTEALRRTAYVVMNKSCLKTPEQGIILVSCCVIGSAVQCSMESFSKLGNTF